MWLWQVNWLWSMLPIPLVLLLASRLRTAGWLMERNTLRAWLLPVAVLVVPAVAILTTVPLYRVYSVPLVDPGFSVEEYARPMTAEEQATLNLYERANLAIVSLRHKDFDFGYPRETMALTADEIAWGDANPKAIAIAMEASRGKLHNPAGKRAGFLLSFKFSILVRLLLCSAVKLEDAGKLDAALDRYLAAVRLSVHLRDWEPAPTWYGDYYNGYGNGADRIEAAVYARLPIWAARPGQTPENPRRRATTSETDVRCFSGQRG